MRCCVLLCVRGGEDTEDTHHHLAPSLISPRIYVLIPVKHLAVSEQLKPEMLKPQHCPSIRTN